jgi:hypothetical protein
MQKYVLTAAPPVRAVAIGAIADLIAAVLLVLGIDRGAVAMIVIGIVVSVLALGLIVAALLLRTKVRTVVRLDDDAVAITSGGKQASATWAEITGVSTDGPTIYLDRKPADGPPLKIGSPRGAADVSFNRLADELTRRLDRNRGYRRLN